MNIKILLFKIAKGPFMGNVVGKAFQYCSWAIPAKKVSNRKEIIAFYHPKPSYENHLIISPKKAIRNLQQMAQESVSKYFVEIWLTIKDICAKHPEYRGSFVIVANGGKRQEVQQVHFHMFTNHEIVNDYVVHEQAESAFYRDEYICVLEHPNPNWEIHYVILPGSTSQMAENEEYKSLYFRKILSSINLLNEKFSIVQKGYSLVYQYDQKKMDLDCPVFHIVSGKKVK